MDTLRMDLSCIKAKIKTRSAFELEQGIAGAMRALPLKRYSAVRAALRQAAGLPPAYRGIIIYLMGLDFDEAVPLLNRAITDAIRALKEQP